METRNVFRRVRLQFPLILSGRLRQIWQTDCMENEGILRCGWINVRAIFRRRGWLTLSPVPIIRQKKYKIIYLPQVEVIECEGPGCTLPPVVAHHAGLENTGRVQYYFCSFRFHLLWAEFVCWRNLKNSPIAWYYLYCSQT